jgi:MFS family permease
MKNTEPDEPVKGEQNGGFGVGSLFSSPRDLLQWLQQLSDAYSIRLIWMLVASQFVLKGFVMGYSLGGFDWLLSARNVPGPTMQIYSAIGMLPFAMKPLIGMLSDAFPILGYQKNPYILLTTMVGLAGLTTIAASGMVTMNVRYLVIGLFCIMMMVSSADVLTEAKYAERIRSCPEKGPDFITFVWLMVTAGGLTATLTLGSVLEALKPHWVYAICLLPAAIIIMPTVLNYLDERKMSPAEVVSVRTHYFAQGELVILVCLVGGASIVIMVTGLVQHSVWVNLAVGLSCAFVVASAFLLLTAPIIGKMVAFGIVQHLMAFSTMGGVFYFFTNGPEQYPEGPHFSPMFLISIVGAVGSIFSLVGFSMFNLFMKRWRYHSVFFTTNIIYSFGHALAAIQFSRLNLTWGISDEVFAISYAIVQSVTTSMLFLPCIVLLTQLCPKNVEATMYALLAGTGNLGTQIGGSVGAAVLTYLGVTPRGDDGESAKFENLWIAALISSFAPMITLVLLPWMIPDALQTERLMDENSTAVQGSPWRRLKDRRRGDETASPGYGAMDA